MDAPEKANHDLKDESFLVLEVLTHLPFSFVLELLQLVVYVFRGSPSCLNHVSGL